MSQLPRRQFLILYGETEAGFFLPNVGLIDLEAQLAVSLAGTCSFCEKQRGLGVACRLGGRVRICNPCLSKCRNELTKAGIPLEVDQIRSTLPGMDDPLGMDRLAAALRRLPDTRDELTDVLRATVPTLADDDPVCRFCFRAREQLRKLIPGPAGVFICDGCAAEGIVLFETMGVSISPGT